MEDEPFFRSSKRRKTQHARLRGATDSSEGQEPQPQPQNDGPNPADEVDIGNLLRLRRQPKTKAGMSFSTERSSNTESDNMALVSTQKVADPVANMTSRFVGSTGGQVVNVDEHMMAYIDSKLAQQRTIPPASSQPDQPTHPSTSTPALPSTIPKPLSSPPHSGAPTSATALNEIDLGSTTSTLNASRTTAALARLHAGLPALPTPSEQHPPRKPRIRIGRDGKPYRPKPRPKHIDAESIAREKLVEQVLREHGVGVHNDEEVRDMAMESLDRTDSAAGAGVKDTDEAFAEQFRREFLEAVAERQARQVQKSGSAGQAKGSSGGVGDGKSGGGGGGPKLGGSRSARAKMQMLQQSQGKK